ncbi:hypothetical protein B0T14DRAFT_428673, partial [Immersiella caudata]
KKHKKTYNTRDSLVVTDPTTSLAVAGLSMGERTGSRIFQCLWSYVAGSPVGVGDKRREQRRARECCPVGCCSRIQARGVFAIQMRWWLNPGKGNLGEAGGC